MSDTSQDKPLDESHAVSDDAWMQRLRKHVAPEDIPASHDLYSAADLEEHLGALGEPHPSLVAVGDIMLGGRAKEPLVHHGAGHPFEAVLPILRRAPIVLGNLEGPLARKSAKELRNYSYRVKPEVARSLTRAGVNVLTLANNHAMDCRRAGVLETLDAVALAGAASIGAGRNERAAHAPVIRLAGRWRIGLLGYYWNRRCAATPDLPGCAIDSPEALTADIGGLRDEVDRVVVTFHWGIPYEREPSREDRAKARFAVDAGADLVVGHHPHVVQPFEIYRGCPIFYSVGNFTFGSGNSRAEGLMLGVRFEETHTAVNVYPLYVKNRDPRVNYQPKVLRGAAAERMLRRLAEVSGTMGGHLTIDRARGTLHLPRSPVPHPSR